MHTLSLILLNITSIPDWGLILLVALLFFGGKKIPELMRGIGQGVSEFNRAKNTVNSEFQEGIRQGNNPNPQQPTQNQVSSTTTSSSVNAIPPASATPTDQLQKQIEQLQQQLNQLKQQQH